MNTNTHSHTHTPQRSKGNAVFKYQGYENYFNFKSLVSSFISHKKKLLAKNKTKQNKKKNCLLYYQLNNLTELNVHFS